MSILVAAELLQHLATEDADRAGDDVDGARERLRAARHVQALDVLERLEARPQVPAVHDLHVAGHRAHVRVAEVPQRRLERVPRQARVAVHAEHERMPRQRDAGVERARLAVVRLADHAEHDVAVPPLERGRAGVRVVARAVVHHQHFVGRVVERQQAPDALPR